MSVAQHLSVTRWRVTGVGGYELATDREIADFAMVNLSGAPVMRFALPFQAVALDQTIAALTAAYALGNRAADVSLMRQLLSALKDVLKTNERWGLTAPRLAAYRAATKAIAEAEGRGHG